MRIASQDHHRQQRSYQGVQVCQLLLVVGDVLQSPDDLGRREAQLGRHREDRRNHQIVQSFEPKEIRSLE